MSSASQRRVASLPVWRGDRRARGATAASPAAGLRTSIRVPLGVILAGLTAACGGGAGPGATTAGAERGGEAAAGAATAEGRPLGSASFVGVEACAPCHPAQEQSWRGSHHDLAMQVADDGTVLGDFGEAVFTQRGVTTRFSRRGEQFWVSTEGPDGQPHEYPVSYTFGVEPLQQYLVAFPGGRYQALDVAWDTRRAEEGGQRWFHLRTQRYEPGDPLHWTGIAYTWNNMCAGCHSTNLEKNYDNAGDSYATSWRDLDVACEACHGPGSRHVAWAEARASRAGAALEVAGEAAMSAAEMGLEADFPRLVDRSWIIDPGTGLARRVPESAPAYDVDVCGRCHARRSVIDEDDQLDRPLTDFYRVSMLDEGLYHADGQILDEVFVYGSFLQSRMYQKGVACGDCHEPHSLKPYNRGNALCNRCHLGAKFDTPEHHHHAVGSEGASCVACHMPARTYMVVDPRRDHSFRLPRPDLSIAYGTPNACGECHAERGDRWAADAVARWFGPERPASHGQRLASGRGGGPRGELDLRGLAADGDAPGIVRATALGLLPPTSQASIAVIAGALDSPDSMVRAGAVAALESADRATMLRLVTPMTADPDRSVRLEAARLMAAIQPPQIPPAARPTVQASIDEYRRAQRLNEDRAQAHLNLGWLALQQGNIPEAEQEYSTAMLREPRFVPSFVNLADLYRRTGRDALGEQLLRQAIAIAPESGDALHALGLLLVRQQRSEEAIDALRQASRRAPGNAHYAYVYAVAVRAEGETREAIEILDGGLALFPFDRELLFAAAAYCRELGEVEQALDYARRLSDLDPDDPRATALLRALESARGRR